MVRTDWGRGLSLLQVIAALGPWYVWPKPINAWLTVSLPHRPLSTQILMSLTNSDDLPLFLGLDLSTQGLKAVLITEESNVVHESCVRFDQDLPHYGTTNGAIIGPGQGEVTSPVVMWLEAFDLIMAKMKTAGVDFTRILGISGDGQVSSAITMNSNNTITNANSKATRFHVLVFQG